MADGDGAVTFGERVVDRADADRLGVGLLPVGAVEHEHDGPRRDVNQAAVELDVAVVVDRGADVLGQQQAVAGAQVGVDVTDAEQAVVAVLFLWRHRARHGHVDLLAGLRCLGEVDDVGVGDAAALAHFGEAGALFDDHLALGAARDAGVDAIRRAAVVGRIGRAEAVVDDAAAAFDVTRHHFAGDVTGDVDLVVAQAADDPRGHVRLGAEHVDRVIAFEGVDLEHLDVLVGHRQAGTEDALVGDDDVVGEFGAKDHQLVEAVAPIDRDRRVDVVFDLVAAGAGADLGFGGGGETRRQLGPRNHLLGIDPVDLGVAGDLHGLGEREGAHREQVVAVVAFQAHHGLVAVDREGVVALAALGQQRRRGARAQPAARRGHRAVLGLRRE